jgi:F0F1-type ATP synthase assembly protein I
MLLTTVWVEPYVLYKHHFHCSVCSYFVRYVLYAAEAAFLLGAVHWGCSFVEGGCIRQLLLRGLLCMALPNLVIVLLHWRTKEFRYVRKKALELLFLAINRWKVP